MHAAVRFPAYATYLVPGRVLPPVGIRPLWPGTLRADSSRAHAPHRVVAPACMRETESLRRTTHVPEPSGRFPFVLVTADCAVSRIPPRGLWLRTRLARVERGIEIVQVPIRHIDMRKEIPCTACAVQTTIALLHLVGSSWRQMASMDRGKHSVWAEYIVCDIAGWSSDFECIHRLCSHIHTSNRSAARVAEGDCAPSAHEVTTGSPGYGRVAPIHTMRKFGCVPAVGRAFYAACSTCCARDVSVVHQDLGLLGCKAVFNVPSAEPWNTLKSVLVGLVGVRAFVLIRNDQVCWPPWVVFRITSRGT